MSFCSVLTCVFFFYWLLSFLLMLLLTSLSFCVSSPYFRCHAPSPPCAFVVSASYSQLTSVWYLRCGLFSAGPHVGESGMHVTASKLTTTLVVVNLFISNHEEFVRCRFGMKASTCTCSLQITAWCYHVVMLNQGN